MKNLKYVLAIIATLIVMSGCDLQDSYDFKPTPIDNHVYMNTWEFIESRQDIFSQLKRAIIHAEMQDLFTQDETKYTYLLLQDVAFYGSDGILNLNGASIVEEMDKEVLRNILLYHIVDGYYHGLGTLTFDPLYVITLWKSELSVMTMKLSNSTSIDNYSRLQINNLAGKSATITAETSNIFPTNGVIHVFLKQLIFKP